MTEYERNQFLVECLESVAIESMEDILFQQLEKQDFRERFAASLAEVVVRRLFGDNGFMFKVQGLVMASVAGANGMVGRVFDRLSDDLPREVRVVLDRMAKEPTS